MHQNSIFTAFDFGCCGTINAVGSRLVTECWSHTAAYQHSLKIDKRWKHLITSSVSILPTWTS